MANLQLARARRPIKACSECYRRKQKCNRKMPCNMCSARRQPEQCVYAHARIDSGTAVPTRSAAEAVGAASDSSDAPFDPTAEATKTTSIDRSELEKITGLTRLASAMQSMDASLGVGSSITAQPQISSAEALCFSLLEQLPSTAVVDELVAIFFDECDWYFGLLERYYFTRWLSEWRSQELARTQASGAGLVARRHLQFSALLFQTLATAVPFVSPSAPCAITLSLANATACDTLSETFSGHAAHILSTCHQHDPTLQTVQTNLLRAFWLKNSSRGKDAWHALGTAIRQAQELELHLESKAPTTDFHDFWDDQFRKRIWAKLFSWDSHMSLNLGRPRFINMDDCTVQAPLDCDFPTQPGTTAPTSQAVTSSSLYTPHYFMLQISRLIHRAMSSGAHRAVPGDPGLVNTLHLEVTHLLQALPPLMQLTQPGEDRRDRLHLCGKRLQIVLNANAFLFALHRQHAQTQPESRIAAVHAALNILSAQQRLFDLLDDVHYRLYMLVYYTVDASLFLACMTFGDAHDLEPHLNQQVIEALRVAGTRLSLMAGRSRLAECALRILGKFEAKTHERQLPQRGAVVSASSSGPREQHRPAPGSVDTADANILCNRTLDSDNFGAPSGINLDFEELLTGITSPNYVMYDFFSSVLSDADPANG